MGELDMDLARATLAEVVGLSEHRMLILVFPKFLDLLF